MFLYRFCSAPVFVFHIIIFFIFLIDIIIYCIIMFKYHVLFFFILFSRLCGSGSSSLSANYRLCGRKSVRMHPRLHQLCCRPRLQLAPAFLPHPLHRRVGPLPALLVGNSPAAASGTKPRPDQSPTSVIQYRHARSQQGWPPSGHALRSLALPARLFAAASHSAFALPSFRFC